jgi:zinc transport system ATP-binding protein
MTMAETCEHCCTRIEDLGVKIGPHTILENINLHINCREMVAVVGPNGAGKTTLLRAILGEILSSGRIYYRVRGDVNRKPLIGYVPQKLDFDHDSPISVVDLVCAAESRRPVWASISRKVRDAARNSLAKVSAEHLLNRKIGELSGGELQRVLLAMAMAPVPDLLLLDEPLSAVDAKGLSIFYGIVADLKKEYDISIIMVTHDITGIAPHAEKMVLLNRTILTEGNPGDILSDGKLMKTFGPELWNVASFPEIREGTGSRNKK